MSGNNQPNVLQLLSALTDAFEAFINSTTMTDEDKKKARADFRVFVEGFKPMVNDQKVGLSINEAELEQRIASFMSKHDKKLQKALSKVVSQKEFKKLQAAVDLINTKVNELKTTVEEHGNWIADQHTTLYGEGATSDKPADGSLVKKVEKLEAVAKSNTSRLDAVEVSGKFKMGWFAIIVIAGLLIGGIIGALASAWVLGMIAGAALGAVVGYIVATNSVPRKKTEKKEPAHAASN